MSVGEGIEICEVDGTAFNVAQEGWLCVECGAWVCPLCIDSETETCYPCMGGA